MKETSVSFNKNQDKRTYKELPGAQMTPWSFLPISLPILSSQCHGCHHCSVLSLPLSSAVVLGCHLVVEAPAVYPASSCLQRWGWVPGAFVILLFSSSCPFYCHLGLWWFLSPFVVLLRRTVPKALSPYTQVTNAPVIHNPVHSQVRNDPPRAISSIPHESARAHVTVILMC
jgi:hypothetical protein